MGASIHYRPLEPGKTLNVSRTSQFIGAMEKAFGSHPWRLSDKERDVLQGMGAAWPDGSDVFEELIEAIERDGDIEVFPVW